MKSAGYYAGQVPQLAAQLLGFLPIALACYLRAWTPRGAKTNKVWPPPYEHLNGRYIDTWAWRWMNAWYGNPEDGVSGMDALVWEGDKLVTYNPTGSRRKAFVWSAWRNSADALKGRFPQS